MVSAKKLRHSSDIGKRDPELKRTWSESSEQAEQFRLVNKRLKTVEARPRAVEENG